VKLLSLISPSKLFHATFKTHYFRFPGTPLVFLQA
jgi:hypothetical protein